jgi:DNA-binding GntR family transcriptional regulator
LTPLLGRPTIPGRMAERTQADLAHNELSHRILILEIPPDDRIVEELWAEKLGVNRSAIREALTRLLGEGLVRRGERGGFFVSEMSDAEIHEIREVRQLAETVDDFASFVKKGYYTAAHEADLRFHNLLMAASGNARLAQLYEKSRIPLFQRKAARALAHPEDFELTEKEHRAILDALRKRDKKRGVEQLRAHFNRGESDALA